jgi:hypothetical protein
VYRPLGVVPRLGCSPARNSPAVVGSLAVSVVGVAAEVRSGVVGGRSKVVAAVATRREAWWCLGGGGRNAAAKSR